MSDNQQTEENNKEEKDKAYNFRQLEEKHQREMIQMKSHIQQIQSEYENKLNQMMKVNQPAPQDDDDDDDPYIDNKKFTKKLSEFEKKLDERFDKKVDSRAKQLLQEDKKNSWINNNPDFYDTLNNYSSKFAEMKPNLAESILQMPEGFERQKLVYHYIKDLGLQNPPEENVQDKINNRPGHSYQPTGINSSPHNFSGDFSKKGQKDAYDRLKELQSRLRI